MTDLINTRDTTGEFDPLTRLAEGEPYFALVGRDRLAPPLIQEWADKNRQRALKEFSEGLINEEKRDRELRKSTQAEAIAWKMHSFKAGDIAAKLTGQPTAKTYSGAEVPEETKRRDRMQALRNAAGSALNNAVAEVSDLVAELESYEDLPTELADLANMLKYCVVAMKGASACVTPKRVIAA